MSKDNKGKKDIYEIFNDINFNEEEFEAVEMNELETARLKKEVRARIETEENIAEEKGDKPIYGESTNENVNKTINKKINSSSDYSDYKEATEVKNKVNKRKGWLRVASIAAMVAIIIGFTPRGREVLAQIADKLFFNPSQGIMTEEQWGNTYVLEEPVRVDINGESVLIKNVINSGDYISIEMWTNEPVDESKPNFKEEYEVLSDKKVKELRENFKLKTLDGKELAVEGYMMASGGYSAISFNKGKDLITEFDLFYGDIQVGHFTLQQIKYVGSYDELGGNTTNNGILIGATSYYLEGERYFRLWSNYDGLELNEYRVNVDHYYNIQVMDDKGKVLNFESANDGTGKAYKLLEDYTGDINLSIKEIDLNYDLKEGTDVSLTLPKKGETRELNKEIQLQGLKDKVVIKAITNNDGQYENGDYIITLDFSDNYDSNRFIYMARERFRTGGTMGDPENKSCEIYLDKEDLSFNERFLGKVKLNLDSILVKQYGDWQFTVK